MKKKIISVICLLASITALNAQDSWSLSRCIEHALEHNIEIKQQELNAEYQQNTLEQNKYDRLPDLNAGLTQNFSFGRSLDNNDSYVNTTSATTGFSLTSDMIIWSGGQINHSIKQQYFQLQSGLEDLEKAKDDITINIAQAYLEILYADEVANVSEQQLELTQKQIERTEKLVESGNTAEGTLLEIKAQAAREYLSLVNAQNDYKLALLDLAQILELESYDGFSIATPVLPEIQAEINLLSANSVYETAVNNRPEIKSANYMLESSYSQLKVAKSGRIPTLSAYAGYYNDYYNAFGSNESSLSLNQQLQDNSRSSVGLSLSVPIFNRFDNKTSIQSAEIQIESKKLELESTKKELRRQIEQAHSNAYAAFESYKANKIAVESMEESFRYTEQKFELGRVNSVEYNEAKTNLTEAQSDLLQAKYRFIFRSKILDFYNGTPISL